MSDRKFTKTVRKTPDTPPRLTLHVRGHQLGVEDHTSGESAKALPGLGRNHPAVEARLPTAGLATRFREWYVSRGYEVTVSDTTPPNPQVVVDPDIGRGLGTEERAYIEALAANRRGRILASSARLRTNLIALAVRAFPKAGVAILVSTRAEARTLAVALQPLLREHIHLVWGEVPCRGQRICICTYQPLFSWRADLTIFPDDRAVLSRLGCEALFALNEQHILGFAAAEHRLSTRCRFELEASLGTVIYEAPGPGGRRAPVHVLRFDVPDLAMLRDADALSRKRAEIWRNGPRNDLVAEVAATLADGELDGLTTPGFDVIDKAGRDEDHAPKRVTVLVEGSEHGRELAARLPGWKLLDGLPATKQLLGDLPGRSIMTMTHAHAYACLDIAVLIRADGDSGPLACPGFPPQRPGPTRVPVLLVDFADRSGSSLRASRARLNSYEAMGWGIRHLSLEQSKSFRS